MDNAYFLDTTLLYETEKQDKPKWPIIWVIFVILLIPILYFGFQKISSLKIFENSGEKVRSIIPEEVKNTIMPPSKPTITIAPTVTKKELARKDLKVEVRNGGGVVGAASKGVAFLKNLGYEIKSSGNAASFNYKDLTIKIKNSKKEFLSLLEEDLKTNYTISSSSADLSEDSSSDALVVIGR
ncbi:LytR C-terminal domain-containing protein [Patescibacteria group bacterium]|nr:LytR C-terminal domain-containing protein [Patescibacteria group bacterium]